jgi:hypothetical protein
MGREASCKARFGGKTGSGKALLETSELVFRGGDLRFTIPYAQIRTIVVKGETLTLRTDAGAADLELGAREAAAWALKIKNPPGRLQKLGVKPAMKVSVVGPVDPAFVAELGAAGAELSQGRPRAGSARLFDLIFLAAEAPADLDMLAALRKSLQPAGALWVIRAKGPAAKVSEAAIMARGKAAGLVDTKVVAFSTTHTAERFVIPVAQR